MCDYSLMAVPNRLAREGEELVSHRFPTGSLGLASPADLKRASDPPLHRRKSFLRSVMEFFDPPRAVPVPAVCIPPGARLELQDIPTRIQKELGVEATAVVTFAMLRTWSVRLPARTFTLSVRSFHVPLTPRTSACPFLKRPRDPAPGTARGAAGTRARSVAG